MLYYTLKKKTTGRVCVLRIKEILTNRIKIICVCVYVFVKEHCRN